MATRPRTTSRESRSGGKPPAGRAANGKRANGSRANGARANGNGNGAVANGAASNGAHPTEAARRIATDLGSAMLVASSLETAQHSDDVELIAGAISEHLGLPEADRADVLAGARLHDIGKASIPRDLLDKPAALSPEEWEVMRTHTIVGAQILQSVRELHGIARLVRHSHERWDGGGYPDGLAGEEIPLGSRIIFCADAFHAIRSDRPYRPGVSASKALAEVRRCAGTQFDPAIVTALDEVVQELRLVPKRARRSSKSSRLTALLLCLAIGGGGSAIGGSGLLGEPTTKPDAPPVVLDCGTLYCASVYGSMPGGSSAGEVARGPLSAVFGPGGALALTEPVPDPGPAGGPNTSSVITPTQGGQGPVGSPPGDPPANPPIDSGTPGSDGGSDGDQGGGSEGSGSTGGGSAGTTPGTSGPVDKNPNWPGNGWGPPSSRPGGGPGPGNAPPAGVGGPPHGQAGPPGGFPPGNSGNAPGHNKPPKP